LGLLNRKKILRKVQITKFGILGGLFDPIHNGHLSLCKAALEQLNLDNVLLIPAYDHPHRQQISSFEQRCEMVLIAIKEFDQYRLSRIESQIEKPSYTTKTLEFLKKDFPETDLYFIIGSDNLSKIETWYEPEDIFEQAKVVMGDRPGPESDLESKYSDRIDRINMTPVDISSTQIREAVRTGQDISNWVPSEVADYISRNGLYVG